MAKILWHSDAGSHTGFGTVTHNIGERLVRDYGHDVYVLGINYKGDHVDTNLKLYLPTKLERLDVYGQSRIVELIAEIVPDVIVELNDPYVIQKFLHRNNWDDERILLRYRSYLPGPLPLTPVTDEGDLLEGIKANPPSILAYMPVDGTNLPHAWDDLAITTKPVLMSNWGKTWLPDAPVVHHGVDTEQFRNIENDPVEMSTGRVVSTKREAKEALGFDPDGFLVVRVDRNSERKNYAGTWKALLPVMRKHKDIQVHFHCKATGDMGVEIPQLLSREPDLFDRFRTPANHGTSQGWTINDLTALYNAADLFVSTSWAEGFGLTLAESIACEVPVIAQNCSSITEVVGPGGDLIEPAGLITALPGQDQWLPDIDAFTEAIEYRYNNPSTLPPLGKVGRKHIEDTFSWDNAARDFDRLIREMQEHE